MKIKTIIKKMSRTIVPLCHIYEYNLENYDFEKFSFDLPEGYTFKYAKDIPLDQLEDFAIKYRKEGYYSDVILKNLSNPNVKGFSIIFEEKEIAMLSWLYLKLNTNKNGIQKTPTNKQIFYPMDGWVVKHHRGHRFHKFSIYKRFWEAKKMEKKFGYGFVYTSNKPALKDNDKFGNRIGLSFKINYPFKTTFNIYKPSHWGLYFKKHIKL